MKRWQSPFWIAVGLSCIVEGVIRIVATQVGDFGPDGQGSFLALVFLLLHLPAIFLTMLVVDNPESKLAYPVEVGASFVVFALVFWGLLAVLKWYVERDDAV